MLERLWSKGNTHSLLVGMQTCATTLEISVVVSHKTGSQITSVSSKSTLGNIPKRCPSILQKYLFNYVHISIVVTARTWKQPRCPSTKNMDKVWHIYMINYYSAIKNNNILNFACKCIEVENNILSEITQTPK